MDPTVRLITDLRAIIMSVPGGLTVHEVKRDYSEIYGNNLFKVCADLGFSSLDAFIAAHPQELRIVNDRIVATLKESSAHLQRLVNEQQKKKTKRRVGGIISRPKPASFIPPGKNFTRTNYKLPPRINPKPVSPLMDQKFEIQNDRNPWPKELFINPPRAIPKTHPKDNIKPDNFVDIDAPFSKFKAKGPPKRPPYRHATTLANNYAEDDEIFKDVPSLDAATIEEKTTAKSKSTKLSKRVDKDGCAPDIYSRLKDLCASLGHSNPEHKICSFKENDKTMYSCLVRAGGQVFTSGSVDSDADTAWNLAVSKAYMQLRAHSSQPAKPDIKSINQEFLKKLHELVKEKPAGLWLKNVPEFYENRYGSEAPEDWEQAVKSCDDFTLASALGLDLLLAATPADRVGTSAPPTSTPSRKSNDAVLPNELDVSPVLQSARTFPELSLEVDQQINVHILLFPTHTSVILRIINEEYEDKLNNMITSMELQLLDKKCTLATSPVVGEYYAVNLGELFIRALLESIEPDGTATVYGIDEGEMEKVPLNRIYHLEDEYFDLAPQALRFYLDGLLNFTYSIELATLMEPLTRKSYVGIVRKLLNFDEDCACRGIIELYDTSILPNVNVNQMLMEQVVNQLPPILRHLEMAEEMVVTFVDDNVLYLKSVNDSADAISSLIEYTAEHLNLVECKVTKIIFDKIYLALHAGTNKLQRIRVTAISDKVEVLFIDQGEIVEIERDQLFDFATKSLLQASPRAAKVALMDLEDWNPAMQKFLKSKLVGANVIVKVKCHLNVPYVELFWRDPKKGVLQCINNLLKTLPAGEIADKQLMTLPGPIIPEVNTLMYVTVALSANPSSFKIRLKNCKEDFYQLMDDLQSFGLDARPILDKNNLKISDILAVKDDDTWYRGRLDIILDDDKYSVQLVDIGGIVFPSLSELRELPNKFRKHPVFLHQACLADVKPAMGDWLPLECVYFQNAVSDKELAAILKRVKILEDGSPELAVTLIDTSDPEIDVLVHEKLIEAGYAVPEVNGI